ncbi:hypothetical protein [Pseudoalteromonas ardens]|uniref:Uncharacterized protein n=1 Tax=Pseudoalteromonas rubra TaxID=43658 RepID=A0A0L0ERX3_9GAMM|nr:hypothetical protein [Pseudoalteromonas sp. R96]KNC66643.1 hypothetical protein AC626_15770 [Pseudoalteromonas rubra]MDK1310464.1 hypothetical protein [Pseudoalteromonas sp. R96]
MKLQVRKSNLKSLSQSQQLNLAQTPNVAGGQIEPNSSYPTYRNCPPPGDSMDCATAPAQGMICVITGPCGDF